MDILTNYRTFQVIKQGIENSILSFEYLKERTKDQESFERFERQIKILKDRLIEIQIEITENQFYDKTK